MPLSRQLCCPATACRAIFPERNRRLEAGEKWFRGDGCVATELRGQVRAQTEFGHEEKAHRLAVLAVMCRAWKCSANRDAHWDLTLTEPVKPTNRFGSVGCFCARNCRVCPAVTDKPCAALAILDDVVSEGLGNDPFCLVPKLRLGMPLSRQLCCPGTACGAGFPDRDLRLETGGTWFRGAGCGQRGCGDKCVPKRSLGTRKARSGRHTGQRAICPRAKAGLASGQSN